MRDLTQELLKSVLRHIRLPLECLSVSLCMQPLSCTCLSHRACVISLCLMLSPMKVEGSADAVLTPDLQAHVGPLSM